MIPVYKPYLPKESLKYAHEAIDSTWISGHGKYLSLVKDKLKELTGCKYVVTTNNGTSATHLLSIALRYKYPNIKNLVVPSNVYIAAWNMFISNPEFELLPVDADPETWNMDLDKLDLEIGSRRVRDTAVLLVHNIGNVYNVPKLQEKYPDIVFIEDNCEGFLGSYGDRPSGSASLASSISFFGNKTLTSGEGGAFCTNDEDVYNHIKRIRSHGITHEKFVFNDLGYNYRMTNVQAAILYGQLEIQEEISRKKRRVFDLYHYHLKDIPEIELQREETGTTSANWMFGIKINKPKEIIDKFKLYLFNNDIDSRPMFPPIHYHKHLNIEVDEYPGNVDEDLYNSVIILPSYPELLDNQIEFICETIKAFFK